MNRLPKTKPDDSTFRQPWALTELLLDTWDAPVYSLQGAKLAYHVAATDCARHFMGIPSLYD